MSKLFNAEVIKLRKSWAYKLILLCSFIYAGTAVYYGCFCDENTSVGFESFVSSVTGWENLLMLSGFLAALFIAHDFSNRGIQTEISIGFARRDVMLAKLLIFTIGSVGLVIGYQLVLVAGTTIVNGFGIAVSMDVISCMVLLELQWIILMIAQFMICAGIAFIIKDLYTVLVVEVLYSALGTTILKTIARNSSGFRKLYNLSIFGQTDNLLVFYFEKLSGAPSESTNLEQVVKAFHGQAGSKMAYVVFISCLTIMVCYAIMYRLFKNCELK